MNIREEVPARSSRPPWWERYRGDVPDDILEFTAAEDRAALVKQFQLNVIPGLLQTAEYSAVIGEIAGAPPWYQHVSDIRKVRREQAVERIPQLRCHFILDESVLRRCIAGSENTGVMIRQLSHIINVANSPRAIIQVTPLARGNHPGAGGSFAVLCGDDGDVQCAHTEDAVSGHLIWVKTLANRYSAYFSEISAVALPPSRSLSFITRVRDDLTEKRSP